MSEANKTQVGGTHYKGKGEEHWDRVVRLRMNYYQAQITKYIERAPLKNGKQDVEKAAHFCKKYLEVYDLLHPAPAVNDGSEATGAYVAQGAELRMPRYVRVQVTVGATGHLLSDLSPTHCLHGVQLNVHCPRCAAQRFASQGD